MSHLHTELQVFEKALPSLLPKHSGEFVVIKDDEVRHFADSYETALAWAYDTFGLERFFVKEVAEAAAATVHFTRDLGPCRG